MKKENSTLLRKLAQYSAMAAPALALASTANAQQIVYTDIDPDFVLTDSAADTFYSGVSLDLDGDGVNDFNIWALSAEQGGNGGGTFNLAGALPYTTSAGANANANGIVGTVNNVGSYYVSALNQGDLIDSNASIWTEVSRVGTLVWDYVAGQNFGQWKNDVTDKYMGVRFLGGDGATHYGWVRMDVSQNPVQVVVKDMAYEATADAGIHAGDAGNTAVPTVSSSANINIVAFEREVFIATTGVAGDQMTIAVRDLLGKTVLDQASKESTVRLSLNDLANGMYLITVNK